jgi:light-regulated signal transduction histidine kinase (bacteriophytochrome)
MATLIDALLDLARITRSELAREPIDVTQLASDVVRNLRGRSPERAIDIEIQPGLTANADPVLVKIVLDNLVGNAWKFTSKMSSDARVVIGSRQEDGETVFFVRDNGAGFDMTYAGKLFKPFQRLHREAEFEGTGVGLATANRIVARHGGRIWAEGAPEAGATVSFTLRQPA